MASAILPLSDEAIAQITSSSKIISLKDVIIGLLRNALDANACKIDVTVDYRRGGCTVEDDGIGIPPREFHETGGLGKKHNTSKYERPESVYGWQGLFLWSLASISLLTVTSHHHLHLSHNSLTLHRSSVIARSTPSLANQRLSFQSHGTRVTVRDLFGNLPVRRKSEYLAGISNGDRSKEWEALKKAIVGLLLAWGGEIEVVVRDVEHDRKVVFRRPNHFQSSNSGSDTRSSISTALVSLAQSLFFQASYLSAQSFKSWVSISGSNSVRAINGAISLEPAPTKQFQFMSLGIEPIFAEAGNNVLFDEVNGLFSASTFGVLEDDDCEVDKRAQEKRSKDTPDHNQNYTGKQLKLQRKGVDKWPMFFLRIDSVSKARHHIERDDILVKDGDLKAILDLLQVLIQRFLEEYGFTVRTRRHCKVIKPNDSLQGSRPLLDFQTLVSQSSPAPRNDKMGPLAGDVFNPDPEKLQDGQPLRRRHSNIRITPRFQTDDLGGGVKFPQLENNRLPGPVTDVGPRTRIKSAKSSGHGCATSMSYELLKRKEQSSVFEGTSFTVNGGLLPGTSSKGHKTYDESPGREASGPTILDDDGKAPMSPGLSPCLAQMPRSNSQDDFAKLDTEVHWLNPHTKTPFCFNARTGFIVPPASSSRLQKPPTPCGRKGMGLDNADTSLNGSLSLRGQENELGSCDWIKGVLAEWKNPVFPPTEEGISRLGSGAVEAGSMLSKDGKCGSFPAIGMLGENCGPVLPSRISRDALRTAKVIAQVDKKFILARLDVEPQTTSQASETISTRKQILVLIDQHAADERCRVESLLSELCTTFSDEINTPRSNRGLRSSIGTSLLDKPLKFQVNDLEYPLYQDYAALFARWGILYDLPSTDRHSERRSETDNVITVKTVPLGVAERCRAEPQLLIKLLREEVWHQKESRTGGKDWPGSNLDGHLPADDLSSHGSGLMANEHRWLRELSNCPRLLLEMLNSRACRSAIMFNDELSLDDCQALMTRLADCAFPFQCAHGRLSMVPLVDLNLSVGPSGSSMHQDSSLAFGVRGKISENAKGDELFIEKFRSWQDEESQSDSVEGEDT
ncbi:MAG: DNA mismatch repair protein [Peltula sp. TS41687]|nr:MAG: DNA mismatch repair protein [Peltula sp. TS41687]